MKTQDLEASPKAYGGIGIVVPFGNRIEINKGGSCLKADLVPDPGGYDQLVQVGHPVGKLVILLRPEVLLVTRIKHGIPVITERKWQLAGLCIQSAIRYKT